MHILIDSEEEGFSQTGATSASSSSMAADNQASGLLEVSMSDTAEAKAILLKQGARVDKLGKLMQSNYVQQLIQQAGNN